MKTKHHVKLEVFWNSSLPNNYPRKEGMAGICIVSQYLYYFNGSEIHVKSRWTKKPTVQSSAHDLPSIFTINFQMIEGPIGCNLKLTPKNSAPGLQDSTTFVKGSTLCRFNPDTFLHKLSSPFALSLHFHQVDRRGTSLFTGTDDTSKTKGIGRDIQGRSHQM